MIRVGIVGMGFGRYGLLPAFRRDGRCTVRALCSRTDATREKFKRELDVPLAFASAVDLVRSSEIDAVAIATSPKDQADIARLAISEGKHVFAEKPLASTAAAAAELAAAAEQKNVAHVVDFIFPELSPFRAAREMLASGALGRVRHVNVEWLMQSFDHKHALKTWKTDVDSGGGVLRHFGSHVVYYLQYLLGEIVTLEGHHTRAALAETTGDTFASFVLAFASGASGAVTLSNVAAIAPIHRIAIHGTTGWLTLENALSDAVRGFALRAGAVGSSAATRTVVDDVPLEEGVDSRVVPVARLVSRFIDWIATGKAARPNFADGARVQTLMDRVRPLDVTVTNGANDVNDEKS